MNSEHQFSGFLIAALVSVGLLFASNTYAAGAGTVISANGSRSILAADGTSRTPSAGAVINQGETAVTGNKGQLDIRFSDESVVRLNSQSQFRIDQYAFSGKNGKEEKGFFSLLKGGMRTVTGMLGKANRSAYRVSTSAATIGIRGTEYSARLDRGLHVSVERGEISLANRAGSFSVQEGQRAYVANQKSAPKYLNLGSSGQSGAKNGASGNTQIRGNTQINANATDSNAIAVGQGNVAGNRTGTIGGK